MLQPLEQAILVAIDRLTHDTYNDTDSERVGDELRAMGFALPPVMPYERLFLQLRDEGYLGQTTTRTGGNGVVHVELTPQGREVARERGDPVEDVWSDARRLLGSERFERMYPGTYSSWADAAGRLLGDQPEAELAQIGFSCRDAVQAFAGALQERYPPETPEPDATKTKNRLKAVITTYKPYLGNRRSAVLDALVELWAADIDLIQRQTHANERADKPLGVNDGRRVVSLTMFLVIEFATILDEMDASSPPATLEPD